MSQRNQTSGLIKTIGTWEVMVAGVALVVAASTLVSDFAGYFTLGAAFVGALLLGFAINLLLGISAADLSVAYPRAGALYDYARSIFSGKTGPFMGTFLGLSFFGMFAFAGAGETAAGAFGLQALFRSDLNIRYFIVILSVLAVIPNILGIKTTARVSAALLLFMLGIRWFFGLAGFLGWGATGEWFAANLDSGVGAFDWLGEGGILSAGLALAFWSFVGIEFACSLAEEVTEPRKSLPRGLLFGLMGILGTSLLMGLGVTGTAPISEWQAAMNSKLGAGGDAPQLVVGHMMFGEIGYSLMALASVAATLGTLTVAFAAMPRIIYSIARDARFFGPLSNTFGKLHPKLGTPVAATLLTFLTYMGPALYSSEVVEWLYSAAYGWIILYVVFHLLAFANRKLHPHAQKAFRGRWFIPMTLAGVAATVVALYYAFAGAHWDYGGRALLVFLGALAATGISFVLSSGTANRAGEPLFRISQKEALGGFIEEPLFAVEEKFEGRNLATKIQSHYPERSGKIFLEYFKKMASLN